MTTIELGALGPDFTADPYAVYAKLRDAGPVHEVLRPDGGRFWLVVGYDECRAALGDGRLSKVSPARSPQDLLMGPHVLSTDPPDHTRLRKLVSREFTARRVEALRGRIQEITDGLLDAMLPAGGGDLVDAFAFPLPITVICELLGVPESDRDDFRRWSNDLVAPTDPAATQQSAFAMRDYLDALIAGKRAGGGGDDLLSALVRTEEDSDRLSADEVRAMAFVLLVAGHETTVNLIANGVRNLLENPAQLAALRADPALIDAAVEEMLRFEGPVENATVRFTREPVGYGDTVVPAGEVVLVGLSSADRDPERFPDPDTFDVRRAADGAAAGHLAFGHGIHFCLGAPLARLEARIAIGTLLERCQDLALDPAAGPYDWVPGLLIRGVRSLPVRW